jgi:hypothetical protein
MYYVYASKDLSHELPFFCWVITNTKEKKAVVATHSRTEPFVVVNDQYLGIFHSYIGIDEWNLIHKEDLSLSPIQTQSKITDYFKESTHVFDLETQTIDSDLKAAKQILNFFAKSDHIVSEKGINFFESYSGPYKKSNLVICDQEIENALETKC